MSDRRKVWLVLDGTSQPLAEADSEREAVAYGEQVAESRGGAAFTITQESSDVIENPNFTPETGPRTGYGRTGLPLILAAKYATCREQLERGEWPHLTADMVDAVSLQEAYERIKDYLPPGKKWQAARLPTKAVGGELRLEDLVVGRDDEDDDEDKAIKQFGMLASNAKLAKGNSPDGRVSIAFGLSLAPHQVGLRDRLGVGKGGSFLPEDFFTPERINTMFDDKVLPNAEEVATMANVSLSALMAMSDLGKRTLGKEFGGMSIGRRAKLSLCFGASAECRASCLVHSGQNPASKEAIRAKLSFTAALYADPLAFCRILLNTLRRYFAAAGCTDKASQDVDLYVRLNVFQDIPWELFFPDLIDPFKQVAFREYDAPKAKPRNWEDRAIVGTGSFYDYTKIPFRMRYFAKHYLAPHHGISEKAALEAARKAYHLTFSYSGSNERNAIETLQDGDNVAMVFIRSMSEEVGGERRSIGAPVPEVSTERAKRTFGPAFARAGRKEKTLAKQLWTWAATGEILSTLARSKIELPEVFQAERQMIAADMINEILGSDISPEDLVLPPTTAKSRHLRGIFSGEHFYDFQFPEGPFKGVPIINADNNDLRAKDSLVLTRGGFDPSKGALVGLDFKVPKIRVEEVAGEKGRLVFSPLDIEKNAFVMGVHEEGGVYYVAQTPPQTMDGSQVGEAI